MPETSVFISYSKKDRAFALPLRDYLEKHSCRTWIDEYDLHPGDIAVDGIFSGIRRADYMAVLLSANSVDSSWCRRELAQGVHLEVDEGSPIVLPVRIDDTPVPDSLITKVAIDARRMAPWQVGNKVLESIHRVDSLAVVAGANRLRPASRTLTRDTRPRRRLRESVSLVAAILTVPLSSRDYVPASASLSDYFTYN